MFAKKIFLMVFISSFLFANSADTYEKKCGVCHGKDGTTLAMGKSKSIKGLPTQEIIKDLNDYSSGEKKATPIVKMMKKAFLSATSTKEVEELAEFINKL